MTRLKLGKLRCIPFIGGSFRYSRSLCARMQPLTHWFFAYCDLLNANPDSR